MKKKLVVILTVITSILFLCLISGPVLAAEGDVDKATLVQIVMKLNKYDIESEKRNSIQDNIVKVLSYGVKKEYIFEYLDNYDFAELKEKIDSITRAVEYNLEAAEINKALEEGNLNKVTGEARTKSLNEREYIITYYTESRKSRTDKVWMPVPRAWNKNSTIDVQIQEIEPSTAEVYTDEHGNKIAYWYRANPHDGEYKIRFKIRLKKVKHEININEYKTDYNRDSEIYERYTDPTARTQSDNREIEQLADKIVENTENPYVKVRQIVDWMNNNISYGEGERDAVSVLEEGQSDCGGIANLFVALCKASGIPARIISILHPLPMMDNDFRSGELFDTLGAHIIAEFYLQDYGWVEVDPGKRDMIGNIPYYFIVLTRGSITEFKQMDFEYEEQFFHLPLADGENLEPATGIEVEK